MNKKVVCCFLSLSSFIFKPEFNLVVNHLIVFFFKHTTKAYQLKWYLKVFSRKTANHDKRSGQQNTILKCVNIYDHFDNLNINQCLILCMNPCLRRQVASGAALPLKLWNSLSLKTFSSCLLHSHDIMNRPPESAGSCAVWSSLCSEQDRKEGWRRRSWDSLNSLQDVT